jgi:hypothetical protein
VSNSGIVSLAGHQVLAAEILPGRLVSIRIEPQTLLFFDPATPELLRSRPTHSPEPKTSGCAVHAPPGRRPGPGPGRSPWNAGSAPPA